MAALSDDRYKRYTFCAAIAKNAVYRGTISLQSMAKPATLDTSSSVANSTIVELTIEAHRKIDMYLGNVCDLNIAKLTSQTDLMKPSTANIKVPPCQLLEQRDIFAIAAHYQKRYEYLNAISATAEAWSDWNEEIYHYFDTGIVAWHASDIMDVPYVYDNNELSTHKDSLKSFYSFLEHWDIYGPGCKLETAKSAESMKDSAAKIARTRVQVILDAAEYNRKNARDLVGRVQDKLRGSTAIVWQAQQLLSGINNRIAHLPSSITLVVAGDGSRPRAA